MSREPSDGKDLLEGGKDINYVKIKIQTQFWHPETTGFIVSLDGGR